jgi:hypothetical protein
MRQTQMNPSAGQFPGLPQGLWPAGMPLGLWQTYSPLALVASVMIESRVAWSAVHRGDGGSRSGI